MHSRKPALQEDGYLGRCYVKTSSLAYQHFRTLPCGQQRKGWGRLAQVQRSGDDAAAVLDYDIKNERVTLTAEQACRSAFQWVASCIVSPAVLCKIP